MPRWKVNVATFSLILSLLTAHRKQEHTVTVKKLCTVKILKFHMSVRLGLIYPTDQTV